MTPEEFEILCIDRENEYKQAEARERDLNRQHLDSLRKRHEALAAWHIVQAYQQLPDEGEITVYDAYNLRQWLFDLFEVQGRFTLDPYSNPPKYTRWMTVTGFEPKREWCVLVAPDAPLGVISVDGLDHVYIKRKKPTSKPSPQ